MSSYNYLQLEFISKYRAEHNIPSILNDDAVVEQIKEEMIKTGKIYPAFESLVTPKSSKGKSKKSVFGEGYIRPQETFDGLKVENIGKKPVKRTLNPLEKSSVRNFIAAMLMEEIKQTCNMFNIVSKPNTVSGQEFVQEVEVLVSELVHELELGKLGIGEPENRKSLAKEINSYFKQIAELSVYADNPKEFDKRYQQIMKKPLDYNVVYDYMEAASKVDNSTIQKKYTNLKKLEKPAQKLQGAIETPVQRKLDKWANRSANLGGLADFAITLVMMYYTGGSAAISKAAQSTGKAVAASATRQAASIGMKENAAEIAGQVAGITSSQVTGAALNAAAFQTMNTIGALQNGSISREEVEMLAESTWGLTKFGYVASALTGPLGMKFGQLVNNAIINQKTLSIIKSSSTKPTTLGNILTTLVKNSNFATKTTEIVSQFAMNAEYMAIDEGISYEESVKSLAQMEGMSKMLIAMMSGKATSFLTDYKVSKVIHLGQNVFKIVRPDGKVDIIPSEAAMMYYMMDRLAVEGAKKGVNEGVKNDVPLTPALSQKERGSESVRKADKKKGNKNYESPELRRLDMGTEKHTLSSDVDKVAPEINDAIKKLNEILPESIHKENQINRIIEACTVDGLISSTLIDSAVKVFKSSTSTLERSGLMACITNMKTETGLDNDACAVFNQLIEQGQNSRVIAAVLASCKNNGKFDNAVYEKLKTFENITNGAILIHTLTRMNGGKFSEDLYQKAMDLKKFGYKEDELCNIMKGCAIKEGTGYQTKVTGFVPEAYDQVSELLNMGIDKNRVPDILQACIEDGKFNQQTFDNIKKVQSVVEQRHINAFIIMPENLLDIAIELQKEYNLESQQLFDVTQQWIKGNSWENVKHEYSLKSAERTQELLKQGLDVKDVEYLIASSKGKDYEIDENLFNKVMELYKAGIDKDKILDIVYDARNSDGEVNLDLLDKTKLWKELGLEDNIISGIVTKIRSEEPLPINLPLDRVETMLRGGLSSDVIWETFTTIIEDKVNFSGDNLDNKPIFASERIINEILYMKKSGVGNPAIHQALTQAQCGQSKINSYNWNRIFKFFECGAKDFAFVHLLKNSDGTMKDEYIPKIRKALLDGMSDTRVTTALVYSKLGYSGKLDMQAFLSYADLSKYYESENIFERFLYTTNLNGSNSNRTEFAKAIAETLKIGVEPQVVLDVAKTIGDKSLHSSEYELIFKKLAENPERAEDIKRVINTHPTNWDTPFGLMELRLNDIDNADPVMRACRLSRSNSINSHAVQFMLNIQGSSSSEVTRTITKNIFRYLQPSEKVAPEVQAKIKEMLETKNERYAELLLRITEVQGYDWTKPECAEVLEHVRKLIDENKITIDDAGRFVHNGYGEMYTNAIEFLDFIQEYKGEEYEPIIEAARNLRVKTIDIKALKELCDFAHNTGNHKNVEVIVQQNQQRTFAELIKKVDFEKYSEEFKIILDQIQGNGGTWYIREFLNENTTAQQINDALEIQSYIKEPIRQSNGKDWQMYADGYLIQLLKDITPEAKEFVINHAKNCHADSYSLSLNDKVKPFVELINKNPKVYNRIKPYENVFYHQHKDFVKNITKALENNCSDVVLEYLCTKDMNSGYYSVDNHPNYAAYGNSITETLIKHPEFLNVLKERDSEFNGSTYDYLLNYYGEEHLDLLTYILTEKTPQGYYRYSRHDIKDLSGRGIGITLGEKNFPNVEDMRFVGDLKNKDGRYAYDFYGVEEVVNKKGEEVQTLKENTPPSEELDSYTLYERTFSQMQDEVAKYGCKTFKEFEALVPTLTGKERGEGGKLLGKIKKQTIDTFLDGLPEHMRGYICSPNGVFSAKDLDNAIKHFNNNPVLRKYISNLKETGKPDFSSKNPDENYSYDEFENYLISEDMKLVHFIKESSSTYPDPAVARKMYTEFNESLDIFIEKFYEIAKVMDTEGLKRNNNDPETYLENEFDRYSRAGMLRLLTVVEPFVGLSNIKALAHNESGIKFPTIIEKTKELASFAENLLSSEHQKMMSDLFKRVKDQEFKALLNVFSALKKGEPQKLVNLLETIAKSKKIDYNFVYGTLMQEIKAKSGVETEMNPKDIDGWDKEYLPYVLSVFDGIGKENQEILAGLIRTTINGGYEEFLFDPNTPNGKRNIESRQILESKGIDFNQFLNFKGKVEFDFTPKEAPLEPIKISATEDFINMANEPTIKPLFEKFAADNKLTFDKQNGIKINGQTPDRQQLLNLMINVNKFINDNRKVIDASKCPDVQDHFLARKRALSKSFNDTKAGGKMTIELSKRDPKQFLFLGFHCQCCVSLDGINRHSLIETMGHTVDQIGELKNSEGKAVGKVKMVFIEDTKTGEVILLANGFEIVEPYNFDNDVRAAFVDFMKGYSKATLGKEVPIYTGVTYQKITYDDLPDVEGNYQLLGRTPNNTYHLDSYSHVGESGSHPKDLDKPHDLKLKVMYDPKSPNNRKPQETTSRKTYEAPAIRTGALEPFMASDDMVAEAMKEHTHKFQSNIATDEDLQAIHKMDTENFEGRDYGIIENFDEYKADLQDNGIETHAIKNQGGYVVGYYQLEPVNNGELYIYSIGVAKPLQKTSSSGLALKKMQEEITNIAKEKGVKKVTLDVEADNSTLINLYKRFGFVEKGKTEFGDIHMEADVEKLNSKSQPQKSEVKETIFEDDFNPVADALKQREANARNGILPDIKKIDFEENYGLSYKMPTNPLQSTEVYFNGKKCTSNEKELRAQFVEQGLDLNNLEMKRFFEWFTEMCKTKEDFVNASILISRKAMQSWELRNRYTQVFRQIKDNEDAALYNLLFSEEYGMSGGLGTSNPIYQIENIVKNIKNNPALYRLFLEGLPKLTNLPHKYYHIENRAYALADVIQYVKTETHVDAVLKIIDSDIQAKRQYILNTLILENTIEKFLNSPEKADDYINFYNSLSGTDYSCTKKLLQSPEKIEMYWNMITSEKYGIIPDYIDEFSCYVCQYDEVGNFENIKILMDKNIDFRSALCAAQCIDDIKQPEFTSQILASNNIYELYETILKEENYKKLSSWRRNYLQGTKDFCSGWYDYGKINKNRLDTVVKLQSILSPKIFYQIKGEMFSENLIKIYNDELLSEKQFIQFAKRQIQYSLGSDDAVYQMAKKWFKIYPSKTENTLLMYMRIAKDGFNKDAVEVALNDAKAKKNQIKSGTKDITNNDIERFFANNADGVSKTVNLIGLSAFEYSFTSKFDGMERLCDASDTIYRNYNDLIKLRESLKNEKSSTPQELERRISELDGMIAKEETTINKIAKTLADKSIEPQEKIKKLETLAALKQCCTEEEFVGFIELIKPNKPSLNQVKQAVDIWANPKMFYEDKWNAFCETFGIEKDNAKVKTFFENRATVNSKGFKILNGVKSSDMQQFLTSIVRSKNQKVWNDAINKKVFDVVGVEYNEDVSRKLDLTSSPDLDLILAGTDEFKRTFRTMIERLAEHPEMSVKEVFDSLPQNIETKRQFALRGVDYDRITTPDKDSYKTVKIKVDAEKTRQNCVTNLVNEFNDVAFKSLPKEETQKILDALNDELGIEARIILEPNYDTDGFLQGQTESLQFFNKDGSHIGFNNLGKMMSVIKKVMNLNDFWSKTNSNREINQYKDTFYDHIMKSRDEEISNAENIKSDKETKVSIQQVDMNEMPYGLMLGAKLCCTSPTGCNAFSASTYVMNKCIGAFDIKDGKIPVGNTMAYLAEIEGRLSLVLDNIEVKIGYQDNVVRDAFMEYVKEWCKEKGLGDIPIYAGPNRHKFTMNGAYPMEKHDVKIIGSTGSDEVYIDYHGKAIIDGESKIDDVDMFVIRLPKGKN